MTNIVIYVTVVHIFLQEYVIMFLVYRCNRNKYGSEGSFIDSQAGRIVLKATYGMTYVMPYRPIWGIINF